MDNQRYSLGHLNEVYRAAETPDSYGSVKDGIYKGLIENAIIRKNQSAKLFISWNLRVVLGGEDTILIQKTNWLTEGAMSMLKRDMKAIGIDPDIIMPLDRLYDILKYLRGAVVEFEQRTKANEQDPDKPFINHNFLRMVREPNNAFPEFTNAGNMGPNNLIPTDEKLPF